MSNCSSSTSSRSTLPFVTLTIVWPASGQPVGGLGVRQRPDLVEGVEVAAGQRERLALVEVAAQADVAVGQREDRLALAQQVEVQAALAHGPRLDVVDLALDHDPSISSARSSTTTSAPCGQEVGGLVGAVDADDPSEVAGAPGLDARQGVLEDGRLLGRLDAQLPARPPGTCPAPACPAACARSATTPSTRASKRSSIPTARRIACVFALDDTTAVLQPALAGQLHEADRALVDLDPLVLDELQDQRVLAVAELAHEAPPRARCPATPGTGARRRSGGGRRRTRM